MEELQKSWSSFFQGSNLLDEEISECVQAFSCNEIKESDISQITDENLNRIGIKATTTRKKVLTYLKERVDRSTAGHSSNINTNQSLKRPETKLKTPDFAILSKLNTYVDKTAAIEVVIEKEACLVTAPRRFGKSSILSMLRYFFSLQTENGTPVSKLFDENTPAPITDTPNYEVFAKPELYIFNQKKVMAEHFGQYPVMNITFKSSIIRSVDDAINECRRIISEVYKAHEYLRTSSKLLPRDQDLCTKWCNDRHLCSNEEIVVSLRDLSRYVRQHFKRKVAVLIDEYDSICSNTMLSLSNTVDSAAVKYVITFFGSILGFLLKDNDENVQLEFITGVSFICTTGLSDLNNVNVYQFLINEPFFPFYGLMESEVDRLLNTFSLNHSVKQIKEDSNGYELNGKKMYSIWSILSYLQEKKLSNYWAKSGVFIGLSGALKCSKVKYYVENLLQGNTIQINPLNKLTPEHVVKLKYAIENPDVNLKDVSTLFMFYLEQGYLTILRATRNQLTVAIPNKEIKEQFEVLLTEYYTSKWGIEIEPLKTCALHFDDACVDSIQHLSEIKESLTSIFNEISPTDEHPLNEAAFHHVLYFLILHTKYKCCTELYCNNRKRLDLCLIFENCGIIIEIKFNGNSLEALNQILTKQYYRVFNDRKYTSCNIEKFIFIGLNIVKQGDDNLSADLSVLIDSKDINEAITL